MRLPVYLDYNSTTPVDPRVFKAMEPYFTERFGNAASIHPYGIEARTAVDEAREAIAALLHAEGPDTIVFTSGATESNNLALKGAAQMLAMKGRHIISQKTEHRSVLEPLQALEREGFRITLLDVDPKGRVSVDSLAAAITPETILVAIMAANNEIGTMQPLTEIGKVCREKKVLFFCDAVQAAGKIPIDVKRNAVSLASISAHKMYGPKGIGALYIAPQMPPIRIAPLIHGGGHERGLRSGTLAVPLIVGLGAAAKLAMECLPQDAERLRQLRTHLSSELSTRLGAVRYNGDPDLTLPGTLNLSFEGVDGEALARELTDLAVSSGAACASARQETSHVLKAIGLPTALAAASLRFSLGRMTTDEEIDFAIQAVERLVRRLRS